MSLYDSRVHERFLHRYLHRKVQLAFSTSDLVYDAVVFFLLFRLFSVMVGYRLASVQEIRITKKLKSSKNYK